MRRKRGNLFIWCVLGFLLLLVVGFVILAYQLNYCKVNEIDIATLINNSSGFYQACVSAITLIFGTETLGVILGGLFANMMFAFIITFTFLAASLMVVWCSRVIVSSMHMRFTR